VCLKSTEAVANVIIGGIGMQIQGATKNLPQQLFAVSGASQVSMGRGREKNINACKGAKYTITI
jgi:hypothetical protein